VDKDEVKRILAPYCPPLSTSQVEAIAEEISKASLKPDVAVTRSIPEEAPRPKKSRKS